METGLNTLQKTLLLKKEVEVDQVDAELCAKREEFRQRMDACTQRQLDLQKKQQKVGPLMLSVLSHLEVFANVLTART